jgi:O-antigen ligase
MFMNFNAKKIIQTLLFVVLLTPLIFFPWIWRPATVSKILFFVPFVILATLASFALFQTKKIVPYLKNPVIFSYGCYVLFVSISSIFGFDPVNSFLGNDIRFGGIILLFCSWLLLVLFFIFFDRASWKRAEFVFVVTAVLISTYALFELVHLVPDFGEKWPRSSSLMGNPIYLASYLIFPLSIALTKIKSQNTWSPGYIIATLIIFSGIAVTGTRGVFLGLVVGGLVALYVSFQKKMQGKKKVLVPLVVIMVLLSGFFLARSFVPTNSFFSRYVRFDDQSSGSRIEFWKMAFLGVKEHPFIGFGYENYFSVSEKYYSSVLYENEASYTDKPHNAYIEILVSSGVIGLAIYGFFLICLFKAIYWARKQKRIDDLQESLFIFGLVAYLTQNFFVFDTVGTFFSLSFFTALIVYLSVDQKSVEVLETRRAPIRNILMILFSLIFILFCTKFVLPTYNYFCLLSDASRELNDVNRFRMLKSIDEISFIYDRNPVGKAFHSNGKRIYNKDGNTQLTKEYVQAAIDQYDALLKLHPKRGEYWYQRADMGLMKAFIGKMNIDEGTKNAVNKAIEFTPVRTEPYVAKATQLEIEGKIPEAIQLLETIRLEIPNSNKLFWALSVLYGKNGQDAKAAEFGFLAIDAGLKVSGIQNILDLINYFAEVKDYDKVIRLYEQAIYFFPEQLDLNANLAAAYATTGQVEKAIMTAMKYKKLKPDASAQADAFIQSLQTSQ